MGIVYVEYTGKRIGGFNITGPTRRAYRVSKTAPLILVDEQDAEYFSSRSDFIVPRAAVKGRQITGVQAGPGAIADTIQPRKRMTRQRNELGTKKVYP